MGSLRARALVDTVAAGKPASRARRNVILIGRQEQDRLSSGPQSSRSRASAREYAAADRQPDDARPTLNTRKPVTGSFCRKRVHDLDALLARRVEREQLSHQLEGDAGLRGLVQSATTADVLQVRSRARASNTRFSSSKSEQRTRGERDDELVVVRGHGSFGPQLLALRGASEVDIFVRRRPQPPMPLRPARSCAHSRRDRDQASVRGEGGWAACPLVRVAGNAMVDPDRSHRSSPPNSARRACIPTEQRGDRRCDDRLANSPRDHCDCIHPGNGAPRCVLSVSGNNLSIAPSCCSCASEVALT